MRNLHRVTQEILAGQKAVQEGYESARREVRLKRAVADAARLLMQAAMWESAVDGLAVDREDRVTRWLLRFRMRRCTRSGRR